MQKKLAHLIILTLLSLALFIPGINSYPVTDRDGAHFAQATKQMLETGNYFKIRFQDKTRYQKPPGINWLQAASVSAFSNSNSSTPWPYRLPSALGALAAVLLSYLFFCKMRDANTALLAATITACSLLLSVESHLVVIDAALLASMILMQGALWCCFANFKSQSPTKPSLRSPLLFWLAMSLGILLKGTTPLIGLLTLLALCIPKANRSFWRHSKPLLGLTILAVTTFAWLAAVNHAEHSNYLLQMINKDLLPKLQGGHQSHGQPPGFYLLILPLIFWPFSLFLWPTAKHTWQQRKSDTAVQFCLAWLLPNWLFYCLMPTKLPQYFLPMLPALAFLTADFISKAKDFFNGAKNSITSKILLSLWWLLAAGMAFAVLAASHYLLNIINWQANLLAITILLTASIASVACWKRVKPKQIFIPVTLGAVLSFAICWQLFLPSLQPLWLSQHIAKSIQNSDDIKLDSKHPIYSIGYYEPSLVFMLGTHNVKYLPASNATHLDGSETTLLLDTKSLDKLVARFSSEQQFKQYYKIQYQLTGFNYSKGHWLQLYLVTANHRTA